MKLISVMNIDMNSEDYDWLSPDARESLNELRASGHDVENIAVRLSMARDPHVQVGKPMVERVLAEMREQARFRVLARRRQ